DLGSGTVTAVSGNVITLSVAPSPWLSGSLIEILNSDGSVHASYVITAISGANVTVQLASGESTANAPVGSAYRGNLGLDKITVGQATLSTPALHGNDLTLSGAIETMELRAQNLTLTGASLRQTPTTTTPNTFNSLNINVAGTLTVSANSIIDATGRGYTGVLSGVGRTYPNTTTGGSTTGAAGRHGGGGKNLGDYYKPEPDAGDAA